MEPAIESDADALTRETLRRRLASAVGFLTLSLSFLLARAAVAANGTRWIYIWVVAGLCAIDLFLFFRGDRTPLRLLTIAIVVNLSTVGGIGLAIAVQVHRTEVTGANYDTFMQLPLSQRKAVWRDLNKYDRATLIVTQIGRWRDTNARRLSPPQIELLDEYIAGAKPEYFDGIRLWSEIDQVAALERRAMRLFTPEERRQALTVDGYYIQK